MDMDGGFKPVVALVAALALACVLISPMPDELPGTAVKLGILPFVIPAGPGFDMWGAQQSMIATLPEAERACRECLALPIYPELSDPLLDRVVEVIGGFYSNARSTRGR